MLINNMAISEITIKEMQQILEEDYGKNISQTEASKIIHNLTDYYNLLAKIYHREKNKNDYDNKTTTKNNY